jgi:periplasmic copper chaperone A
MMHLAVRLMAGVARSAVLTLLSVALVAVPLEPGAAAPAIEVESGWSRPLPPAVKSTEFYMMIHNRGDQPDRLVGADSSACGMARLYEIYTSPQGVMSMRPVPPQGIELPAGGRVQLKPGGLHVMCMDRKREFARGGRVPLTLRFERAGEVHAEVTIREP